MIYFIQTHGAVSLLQQYQLIRTMKKLSYLLKPFRQRKPITNKPVCFYDYSGLHELADFLISKFRPEVANNKSVFINEIPAHLELMADKQLLSAILNGLFSVVTTYTKDSCIRLSAKTNGNRVSIQIKESVSLDRAVVENGVYKLQSLAEKLRGSIGVTSRRKKPTTITFGFPNLTLN